MWHYMREGTQHIVALSLEGLLGPTTNRDGIASPCPSQLHALHWPAYTFSFFFFLLTLLPLHKEVMIQGLIEESPGLKLPDAQVDLHGEKKRRREYSMWVGIHLDKYTSLQVSSPTRWLIARLREYKSGRVLQENLFVHTWTSNGTTYTVIHSYK